MTNRDLIQLAAAAGLSPEWVDFKGETHVVAPDSLRAVLTAMGLESHSRATIAESRARLAETARRPPALVVGRCGDAVRVAGLKAPATIRLESGATVPASLDADGQLRLPEEPGYHELVFGGTRVSLAAAPPACWRIADATGHARRVWGSAAQVYSLPHGGTAGFGDFAALGEAADVLGRLGADVLAVSPVHALFAADPGRYGPYGPSTRLFLNGLYADTSPLLPPDEMSGEAELIDWPQAGLRKWQRLRQAFSRLDDHPGLHAPFEAFIRDGGDELMAHARFEALDARFRSLGRYHWIDWPDGYADAASPAVAALDASEPEVRFHLFVQFLAARSLDAAQVRARAAGMAIGLIADLAVGMDGAGSHAWSRPGDVLTGIGIGAPPDLLGPNGQNWGLTTFSPRALATTGYAPFLATLRAAMRYAGGVRIDHAMGLKRLWVVPEGASATQGLYLAYPLEDLLNLTALESHRHRTIVIGEDLGTVPEGFRETMADHGILGMRVLWFEQDEDGAVPKPQDWQGDAAAMSTTHDLPTIAGWLRGNDIAWRAQIDGADPAAAMKERDIDRTRLLERIGADPSADEGALVDAAIAYVGETACELAIVPLEDLAGLAEQPNLPGTIDEHPNWRRRLPADLDTRADVKRRAMLLNAMRPKT